MRWMKDLANSAVHLASVQGDCEHLRNMFKCLRRLHKPDASDNLDAEALLLAAAHLDHEVLKTRLLADRIKTQQATVSHEHLLVRFND